MYVLWFIVLKNLFTRGDFDRYGGIGSVCFRRMVMSCRHKRIIIICVLSTGVDVYYIFESCMEKNIHYLQVYD